MVEPFGALVGLTVALLAVPGCNKSGVGVGVATEPGEAPQHVEFRWKSGPSALAGNISTTAPDGTQYAGRFMEITSTTTVQDVSPFYGQWYWGWSPGWDGWVGYGYPPTAQAYITHYSGRVLATLTSQRGDIMHCVFTLERPPEGMSGGGMGQCSTSLGLSIQSASFQPHS